MIGCKISSKLTLDPELLVEIISENTDKETRNKNA